MPTTETKRRKAAKEAERLATDRSYRAALKVELKTIRDRAKALLSLPSKGNGALEPIERAELRDAYDKAMPRGQPTPGRPSKVPYRFGDVFGRDPAPSGA